MEKFSITFKQIDNDVIATSSLACNNTTKHVYLAGTSGSYVYYDEYTFTPGTGWAKSPGPYAGMPWSVQKSKTNLGASPETLTWYTYSGDLTSSTWTKCTDGTHDHLESIH